MSVTAHARRCFELKTESSRVLLDYDAGNESLLRHAPMRNQHNTTPSSAPKFVQLGGEWLNVKPPQLEVPPLGSAELAGVSSVLVSSAEATLALPFLTEYNPFSGGIYGTVAALQLGRQLMLEIVALHRTAREYPSNGIGAALGSRDPVHVLEHPSPGAGGLTPALTGDGAPPADVVDDLQQLGEHFRRDVLLMRWRARGWKVADNPSGASPPRRVCVQAVSCG